MRGRTVLLVAFVCMIPIGTVSTAVQQPQAGSTIADQQEQPPVDSYVVEQGDYCEPIEPLSSGESVESFYDYRSHETHSEGVPRLYSSYGTTDLQENDTSVLFLHEGPNGTSLVTVHDRLGGDFDGGTATYEIAGLPSDSGWAVEDDTYTGESNVDEFRRGEGWASASWFWQDNRTDGGAIQGGIDGEFAVTIHPAFNDESQFSDDDVGSELGDDAVIDDWKVLSGSADSPDRLTLPSLDEPVTIRTGTCDDPAVTYERTDNGITATVEGTGADGAVSLQALSGTNDDAQFERIDVSADGDEFELSFENTPPEDLPDSPEGVVSISYLTVTSDGLPADTSATVTFSVAKDRLDVSSTEPQEITLYERDGDTWRQTPTRLAEETDTSYRFVANASTVSAYTVAPARPDPNQSVDQTPAGDGGSDSMSGFGIAGTAGAVLTLIGLWAVRFRDR
jgi:hypothetical protein